MQRLYASSNGYKDELAWAAAWLFRATGEARFRNDAKKYYNQVHHMLRLSCRLYCVRLESLPLKFKDLFARLVVVASHGHQMSLMVRSRFADAELPC